MMNETSSFIRISFHPPLVSGEKVRVLDIELGEELVQDALETVDISTGAWVFLSTREHIKKGVFRDRERVKKLVIDTLCQNFDSLLGIKDTENGYQKGE